jgi:hypothetical protein
MSCCTFSPLKSKPTSPAPKAEEPKTEPPVVEALPTPAAMFVPVIIAPEAGARPALDAVSTFRAFRGAGGTIHQCPRVYALFQFVHFLAGCTRRFPIDSQDSFYIAFALLCCI